jgi:hypothetical protein
VFSARGGNDILIGRTLFVGCPLGARPVSSAELDGFAFAFFVFTDISGCSPSESEPAFFRLPELLACFCGMAGAIKEVEQNLNEGDEINRERAMGQDMTRSYSVL